MLPTPPPGNRLFAAAAADVPISGSRWELAAATPHIADECEVVESIELELESLDWLWRAEKQTKSGIIIIQTA